MKKKKSNKKEIKLNKETLTGFFSLLKQVFKFGQENLRIKKIVIPALVTTVVLASFPTLTSYINSLMWNSVQLASGKKDVSIAVQFALISMGVWMLPFFIRMILGRFSHRIRLFFREHVNFIYDKKMANLDYAYYDDPEFHNLLKSVENHGKNSVNQMYNLQFEVIEIIISVILSALVISTIGIQFIAIMALAVIPLFIFEIRIRKVLKKLNDENNIKYREAGAYAREIGRRETRIFSLNEPYLNKNFEIVEGVIKQILSFHDKNVFVVIGAFMLFGIGLGYSIFAIFKQAVVGNILIGTATFQISALWMFTNTLRSILDMVAGTFENTLYAKEFFQVIHLPKKIIEKENAIRVNREPAPEIIFDNVSFKYPGKDDYSLKQVSFRIYAGSKVALVGENGGGKSTILKLLLRFYDPTVGRILVNGTDLRDVNLESYRDLIGYVAQSPAIPSLTINDILCHEKEISHEEVMSAIEKARAGTFIDKYEHGINQRVGKMFDDGVDPSDGQRQRLAIARAYSKNPRLLIFDEPTADLDPETTAHVFNDFYHNNGTSTGILVAHSLQGVISADTIFVFEDGNLIQCGSHSKLMKQYGKWYKNSFDDQFSNILSVKEVLNFSIH